MTKNVVLSEWSSYSANVLPEDAGDVQVQETRRAFYAGAASMLRLVTTGLDEGSEATEADLQRLTDIDDEVQAFADDVKAGRA